MRAMIKLPQGLLDHIEAVERLAPNGGLAEKKDAWRRLCQAIMKKRILPTILNESGSKSYAADPDQFLALQERYIHVATRITGRLQHPREKHDLTVENPDPLSEWRDKDGTTHLRSRVCIPEDDLWKAGKARAEKSPRKRLGRPPDFDWDAVREEAVRIRKCKGDFDKRKPGWDCKARLEEHLMTFCLNKFGKEPVHSMLCVKISDWFPDLKADRRKVEN
jgi:hypothetical protein